MQVLTSYSLLVIAIDVVFLELTSSWEGESAGQSQFSRSHSSGGAQRDPSRSPFTGRYDYRGMSQEDLVSGHDQCKVSHIFKSSIPSGQTEVDYITVHKDISVKTCIDQCCKLGAQLCQYAWLFTEQCILVGCSQQNATKCLPLNMPTLQDTSTYVSLQYPYPDNIPYAGMYPVNTPIQVYVLYEVCTLTPPNMLCVLVE